MAPLAGILLVLIVVVPVRSARVVAVVVQVPLVLVVVVVVRVPLVLVVVVVVRVPLAHTEEVLEDLEVPPEEVPPEEAHGLNLHPCRLEEEVVRHLHHPPMPCKGKSGSPLQLSHHLMPPARSHGEHGCGN